MKKSIFTKIGVKGAESLAEVMDSPLIFWYRFTEISFSGANHTPKLNWTEGGTSKISLKG